MPDSVIRKLQLYHSNPVNSINLYHNVHREIIKSVQTYSSKNYTWTIQYNSPRNENYLEWQRDNFILNQYAASHDYARNAKANVKIADSIAQKLLNEL